MSHQPYEDCKSLEIDKVVEWKIGSLILGPLKNLIHQIIFCENVLNKTL